MPTLTFANLPVSGLARDRVLRWLGPATRLRPDPPRPEDTPLDGDSAA